MKTYTAVALSMPLVASAFAPSGYIKPSTRTTETKMSMAADENVMRGALRQFGTLAIAASLAFNPIAAVAQESFQSPIYSSSVQISETIKVLDMVGVGVLLLVDS